MKSFTLKVVTPTRELFNGSVEHVWLPGVEGYFGVLADHAPFLSILNVGVAKFRSSAGEKILAVTGGYAEVSENTVTVLARSAEFAEEVEAGRAESSLRRASDRLASRPAGTDVERARAALSRAQLRVGLSKTTRKS